MIIIIESETAIIQYNFIIIYTQHTVHTVQFY